METIKNIQGGDTQDAVLTNVKEIYASKREFLALKNDGTLAIWGNSSKVWGNEPEFTDIVKVFEGYEFFIVQDSKGKIYAVNDIIHYKDFQNKTNLKDYVSHYEAYTLLFEDGTAYSFGPHRNENIAYGKDLTNIQDIYNSETTSFSALKKDGTVEGWESTDVYNGSYRYDWNTTGIDNVIDIINNSSSFVGIRQDKTLVGWGNLDKGGDVSDIDATNFTELHYTNTSYAALNSDGTITRWGEDHFYDNNNGLVVENVNTLYSNSSAYVALINDGSVLSWGRDVTRNEIKLQNIEEIFHTRGSFAALSNNGNVSTWGDINFGGDSGNLDLSNAKYVIGAMFGFSIIKNDGSTVVWGSGITNENNESVKLF